MSLFDTRMGFRKPKDPIQSDAMDDDLRTGLWNCIQFVYFKDSYKAFTFDGDDLGPFIQKLWHLYYKRPIDAIPRHWDQAYQQIRDQFFDCVWYDVYATVEFFLAHFPHRGNDRDRIQNLCNDVLEREKSGYRLVGNEFVPITSKEELSEVEEALSHGGSLQPVTAHLADALQKLSDRKAPDYRNSIKEAISAVEAVCQLIGGNSATLGQALKVVEGKLPLHKALTAAFDKLYGYTSDAEGIRHALLDEPTLEFEDAKFMLVSCSAFINYLVAKASRAGLSL